MVFFTCGYCGDSIKKPAVEKHYSFKCRGSPSLTCVDCLKDFEGDGYKAHTKCMTEDERYSGQGYVPKESTAKGEKKQSSWCESIQGLLNLPNLSQDERKILEIISQHDNVPRKRAKFENFLQNVCRQYARQPALVDRVWNHMESLKKKPEAPSKVKDKNQEETSVKDGSKKTAKSITSNGNHTNHDETSVEVEKPEKKRKKKCDPDDEEPKVKKSNRAEEFSEWKNPKANLSWQEKITKILANPKNKDITYDKLCEKVFKYFVNFPALKSKLQNELAKLNISIE